MGAVPESGNIELQSRHNRQRYQERWFTSPLSVAFTLIPGLDSANCNENLPRMRSSNVRVAMCSDSVGSHLRVDSSGGTCRNIAYIVYSRAKQAPSISCDFLGVGAHVGDVSFDGFDLFGIVVFSPKQNFFFLPVMCHRLEVYKCISR